MVIQQAKVYMRRLSLGLGALGLFFLCSQALSSSGAVPPLSQARDAKRYFLIDWIGREAKSELRMRIPRAYVGVYRLRNASDPVEFYMLNTTLDGLGPQQKVIWPTGKPPSPSDALTQKKWLEQFTIIVKNRAIAGEGHILTFGNGVIDPGKYSPMGNAVVAVVHELSPKYGLRHYQQRYCKEAVATKNVYIDELPEGCEDGKRDFYISPADAHPPVFMVCSSFKNPALKNAELGGCEAYFHYRSWMFSSIFRQTSRWREVDSASRALLDRFLVN